MSYKNAFKGWDKLTISDLLVAYRKSKADCFFEQNSFPTAARFARYEVDLLENLRTLLAKLKAANGFRDISYLIGDYRVVPKKLSFEATRKEKRKHIFFSDASRTIENLKKSSELTAEFRIIGDFPVDMHILSALWVNTVGHKFDACLFDCCYSGRLKRSPQETDSRINAKGPYHLSSIGSFQPYYRPYKKWRDDGLSALRNELENGNDVISILMDVKDYYHSIDPIFLASTELQRTLGLAGAQALSSVEKQFTDELAFFLKKWSDGAAAFSSRFFPGGSNKNTLGGLVLGLSASRIVSNVLLHSWDGLIGEKIAPIYYGRYVDDLFLVVRHTERIFCPDDVMCFLQARLGKETIQKKSNENEHDVWTINIGRKLQRQSEIILNAKKQQCFLLHGEGGISLLERIEGQIRKFSSEHRMMPSDEGGGRSFAANVLGSTVDDEVTGTFQGEDGVTVRRLRWALQLRRIEGLARDLPPNEWEVLRAEFYDFACNHILRADTIVAYFDYLPRLFGLAIQLRDWSQARRLATHVVDSLENLANWTAEADQRVYLNGREIGIGTGIWSYAVGALQWRLVEAAGRFFDMDLIARNDFSREALKLDDSFVAKIFNQMVEYKDHPDEVFAMNELIGTAISIAKADLANEPYKVALKKFPNLLMHMFDKEKEKRILSHFTSVQLVDTNSLRIFLRSSRERRRSVVGNKPLKGESYFPYLFPTRPYTHSEIAEMAPECVGLPSTGNVKCSLPPSVIWARYSQAIRGVPGQHTRMTKAQETRRPEFSENKKTKLFIGTRQGERITVALTSIKTTEQDWAHAADGRPNLSLERYSRIARLVNHLTSLSPKPDYALFPELSLPIAWVDTVADKLLRSGISLIAGTEYHHLHGNKIVSKACLVLTDDRLGIPDRVKIWQPKLEPAVNEEKLLYSKFGKEWHIDSQTKVSKPIYVHNGVHFGVMICSELLNSKERIAFQGEVDALMILSWNRDLETFSSLIKAAALDVHTYMVLVNNRKYGDSRVRAPAREWFRRDIARVRGGENDFVVAATLEIDKLREFQSRAKRWPHEGDKFKPVPEGYIIDHLRRRVPD